MLFLQSGPNSKLSEAHKPKPVGYAMPRMSFILLQRASQSAAGVTAGILCWWYGFKNRQSVTLIECPVLMLHVYSFRIQRLVGSMLES